MRSYPNTWMKATIAADLKRIAGYGSFDGSRQAADYLRRCRGVHAASGTMIVFTRDVGHHESGWWKNPDYERCWHLSLSFFDPTTLAAAMMHGRDSDPAPRDKKLTREWVHAFFGADRTKLWCEPPFSDQGKAREVWHYRLFCDRHWRPIVPRGEVYSKELTEAGWKSWTEVQANLNADAETLRTMQADSSRCQADP